MNGVAAGLAVLAALLFAVASVVQRAAAADVPDAASRGRRLLVRLARSPRWWVGTAGDTAAFAAQAAALGLGSVLLVQPLLVTTVLFALPLEARRCSRPVTRREWVCAAALVAALAVFVVGGEPTAGHARGPTSRWLMAGTVLTLVVVCCVVLAGRRRGPRRAAFLAAAAGAVYGLVGVLTKSVVALLSHGLVPLVTGWETWALGLAVAVGTLLQQVAYGAGPLSASLPAVTVGEPLIAAVLGVAVLGEHIRAPGAQSALIGVSVVVMIVATSVLASSAAESATDDVATATVAPPR